MLKSYLMMQVFVFRSVYRPVMFEMVTRLEYVWETLAYGGETTLPWLPLRP